MYAKLLQDEEFVKLLVNEFGDITSQGELDRKKLADMVFCDNKKLQRLNDIAHPIIMENVFNQMRSENAIFCEVPLLFESGYEKFFNNVIVVLRDKKERISAVIKRDNLTESAVLLRICSQFDYEKADFSKYYVIHNTSDIADLRKNTLEILNLIMS